MGKGGPAQLPRRERFYERVDRSGDCWLWTGSINRRRGGYGYFYDDDQRLRRAHRVAWELEVGELTPDVVLRHTCDTPACVRVSHLRVGSQADNLDDMRSKGRDFRFTVENVERGTDRYNAKLDPDKVRRLRAARANGESVAALAREMGVTQAAAQMAASGKTWAHVD